MSLPFDAKRVREYEVVSDADGQRLGYKFNLDNESLLFLHQSQITPEMEQLIASLGVEKQKIPVVEVLLTDFDGTRTVYPAKMPLPELISSDDTDEGILVRRSYTKTDQRDEQGRIVYVERN